MKRVIFLLSFVITLPCMRAQTNVDSLVNVLNTQKLASSEKIELYRNICKYYDDDNFRDRLMYAEKGLNLAKKIKDKTSAAKFCIFIGFMYGNIADWDSTLIWIEKGIDYALESEDQRLIAGAYNNMASAYMGKHKEIIALEYLLKVYDIAEKIDDKELYMLASGNIGSIFSILNNPDKAIFYFEKVKSIAEEINNPYGQVSALSSLSTVYTKTQNPEKTIIHATKALEMSREYGFKSDESRANTILGRECARQGDYNKAIEYAQEALRIADEISNQEDKANALYLLAKINLDKERYRECVDFAMRAWQIDSVSMSFGGGTANLLSSAYIYIGDKANAEYYLNRYGDIIKEASAADFQHTIANMEVKYETEKKELHIASLEKEKQLYIWLGVAGVSVFILLLGILFYRHRLNVQKVNQLEQEKQLIATQAVLDGETAERSRLARDLHDGLGGMLSVVKLNLKEMSNYSILDGQDVDRFSNALGMLEQSITELRRIAHHMMPESLMRYGLKVSIEDFCRAVPNAHFQYYGSEERLDDRLEVVLYRCAYELVNNAVKYAEATTINVQLMIDNGLLSLTVQDDGIGFDPEKISSGSGLANIRTRVSAYTGKMIIHSAPSKGTEVSVEIENAT